VPEWLWQESVGRTTHRFMVAGRRSALRGNLWNEGAAPPEGRPLEVLVYRSRLIGADPDLVVWGGGNTSVKTQEPDHLGRIREVLRIKGSGTDLKTIHQSGFPGVFRADVLPLLERADMSDEEMVAYLEHCVVEPSGPRPSIETLLHGFMPAAHTDHTHPDAVIAVACSVNGQEWMRQIYGARAAWVDYIRPGFALSKQIALAVRDNPMVECVVMGKHGLVTWGDEPKACYDHTIAIIQEAEDYLAHRANRRRVFGEITTPALDAGARRAIAEQVMPVLRGAARLPRAILHFDDAPDVLDFVGAAHAKDIALVGAACPDHLVHTKRVPLFVEWDGSDVKALLSNVRAHAQAPAADATPATAAPPAQSTDASSGWFHGGQSHFTAAGFLGANLGRNVTSTGMDFGGQAADFSR